MNPAVLALATRSFNGLAKNIGWHLAIGGLTAMTLAALFCVFQTQANQSAPGLAFMRWSSQLNLLMITLAGIGIFATCITSEREAGTLSLLRLAGLGSVGIISARWLPLLCSSFALLVVQIPLALFAVTLGGVTPSHVIAAFVAMALHLFLVTAIGLWVSVHCRTISGAILLATVLLGFWSLGPKALMPVLGLLGSFSRVMLAEILSMHDILDGLGTVSGFGRVSQILSSSTRPAWWDWPDLWQVGVGMVAIAWAWLAFELRTASDEPVIAKPVFRLHKHLPLWPTAIVWKDFRFVGGDWRGMKIRTLLYPLAGALLGGWSLEKFYEPVLRMWGWDGAMLLAQLYHREFREETWDNLRLTPQSVPQLCYSKLAGVALALVPGAIWMEYSRQHWQFAIGGVEHLFYCSMILRGWHMTVLFSVLFHRFTWVVAFLVGIMSATMEFEMVGSIALNGGHPETVLWICFMGNLLVCGMIHALIAMRIRWLSQ